MQLSLGFLLFVVSMYLFGYVVNPRPLQIFVPQIGLIMSAGGAFVALGAIYGFFRDRGKHDWGVLVLIVVVSAGATFGYMVWSTRPVGSQSTAAPQVLDLERAAVIPLDPFVVNLADADAARYLRVKIDLMVDDKTKMQAVEENRALQLKIRDSIVRILTTKTSSDLIGEDGKAKLRREIQYMVGSYFKAARMPMLVDVLFTEFVIQL